MAVDSAGNVYVADTDNHTIRKVTPGGVVTTLAGLAGSSGQRRRHGQRRAVQLPIRRGGGQRGQRVRGGHLQPHDPEGDARRRGDDAGRAGGKLRAAPTARAAPRGSTIPYGVAVDSAGNVYVADTGNHTIRKVTPGRRGDDAGRAGGKLRAAPTARAAPRGSTAHPAWRWTARATSTWRTSCNHTIRKVTPGGVVTTLAGLAGSSGQRRRHGQRRAVQPSLRRGGGQRGQRLRGGHRQPHDSEGDARRRGDDAGGLAGSYGSADGTGSAARFYCPCGVAVDSAGNVYVADSDNHTIRKVTPGGVVTTLAGLAGSSGSADGTGSAARFYDPYGVAVDSAGNVYVADYRNHTIRKVTPGGVVTTLAGLAGSSGSADGTGSAARFYYPYGVAVDSAGNVYVADTCNNTIRKVTPGGVVTTLAGVAGYPVGGVELRRQRRRHGQRRALQLAQPAWRWTARATCTWRTPGNNTIRLGRPACPDAPTIDLVTGPVGQARQLDTSPQTAVAWQWRLVRIPAGSATRLVDRQRPQSHLHARRGGFVHFPTHGHQRGRGHRHPHPGLYRRAAPAGVPGSQAHPGHARSDLEHGGRSELPVGVPFRSQLDELDEPGRPADRHRPHAQRDRLRHERPGPLLPHGALAGRPLGSTTRFMKLLQSFSLLRRVDS